MQDKVIWTKEENQEEKSLLEGQAKTVKKKKRKITEDGSKEQRRGPRGKMAEE